jgi:hypothetical protein
MIIGYLLIFCRTALGLLFFFSFLGKAPNLPPFERTLAGLGILPERFNRIAAFLFLIGELAVILLLAFDGQLLGLGFALAALLLLFSSLALGSALARRTELAYPGLGARQRPLSYYDLWRNVGFIGCALAGWAAFILAGHSQMHLSLAEGVLAGLCAAVFVAAWTQLGEIVRLFRLA